VSTSGRARRLIVSRPPSTLSRGLNDDAETLRTKVNSNHGRHWAVIIVAPPTAARRRATSHCTSSTASVQPGTVQDAPQHRRRQVKWQVADNDVRCAGQPVVQEVGVHGPRRCRRALLEARGSAGVDLDGQRACEFLQGQGERTVAGANFDDGTVGARDEVDDGVDDTAIMNEVLAVLMSAVTRE
jgi:hypothetical protein